MKGEALKVGDADKIINCLLYGKAYFQKDNNYILYLYKTAKDKYLQIAVAPQFEQSAKGSSLNIPVVRNVQFINEVQKTSKLNSMNLEIIK